MPRQTFAFSVEGRPRTAGSKRAFVIKKGGQPTNRAGIVDDSGENGKQWRGLVEDAGRKAIGAPLDGAVMVEITLYFHRPKGHYFTGKRARELRPDAPKLHTVKPDATKCQRSIEDALKGIAWRDDSQVSDIACRKRWRCRWGHEPEAADIIIVELT